MNHACTDPTRVVYRKNPQGKVIDLFGAIALRGYEDAQPGRRIFILLIFRDRPGKSSRTYPFTGGFLTVLAQLPIKIGSFELLVVFGVVERQFAIIVPRSRVCTRL